ncbi:MAG TPA: hypothetical protein VM008_05830 [Phycisphaerae bacterium]|nr:hypothetical protein [Phycisphaerae bacterium]
MKFEMRSQDQHGNETIFKTDSEAAFLQRILAEHLEGYEVTRATLMVRELGDGWYRIGLSCDSEELGEDSAIDLQTDLMASIGGGKGWYECRDSGSSDDGKTEWWETRHIRGPYI